MAGARSRALCLRLASRVHNGGIHVVHQLRRASRTRNGRHAGHHLQRRAAPAMAAMPCLTCVAAMP